MDSKRDIYNLWVQYTTKNDESYFRQFISGFVQIWTSQLNLNLDDDPTPPQDVKSDLGPHIKRLPEELIPAIQKFLIISKTTISQNNCDDAELQQVSLLIKCLTIIVRNFDNINLIIRSNFISCVVEICHHLLNGTSSSTLSVEENDLVKVCCEFIELVYDPCLKWRHFTRSHQLSVVGGASYHVDPQLHPEIVPFIYTCFEAVTPEKVANLNAVGSSLLNVLGSVTIGANKNGRMVICPATSNVIMRLISNWTVDGKVRQRALDNLNIMLIVLLKSNPVERQIEVDVVIQEYLDAIGALIETHNQKSSEPSVVTCWDTSALLSLLQNFVVLLSETSTATSLCHVLLKANVMAALVTVPERMRSSLFDVEMIIRCTAVVVEVFTVVVRCVDVQVPPKVIKKLFVGIRNVTSSPTGNCKELVVKCLELATNPNDSLAIDSFVVKELFQWVPELNSIEQELITVSLSDICTRNSNRVFSLAESSIVATVTSVLKDHSKLSRERVIDLLNVVKHLGRVSISPRELRHLLTLMDDEFPYRYELIDVLTEIASDSLTGHVPEMNDFWNIQRKAEGISVPDIELWSTNTPTSGFVFHACVRLAEAQENRECSDESAKYFFRRQLLFLGSGQGTGFEVFLSQDGSLSLAAITKKEYHTVTCSEAKLFDNKWHTITVAVVPSKRPFSYFNVSFYRDGETLLATNLKIATTSEKFTICSIGTPLMNEKGSFGNEPNEAPSETPAPGRGLFPSIFEKALPSIVSQAPNYFTFPLKGFSSHDSHTKTVALGLQNNIFGAPTSLQGHLGCVLLAESGTSLKTLFEAGQQFASIISHEHETLDQFSRIVFCYSSTAAADGSCMDLSGGRRIHGLTSSKNVHTISFQNALHSIGGVTSILPILEFSTASEESALNSMNVSEDKSFQSGKLMQNPVAYFLVILRYLLNDKRLIQECGEFVPLMSVLIQKCEPEHLDVQVLMAMQILIENLVQHQLFQQQKDKEELSQSDSKVVNQFVDLFNGHIVFNFRIWSRAAFQIIIGHIQYLQTLIKSDRKRYRKKYGVQFILDTIRIHFIAPNNITESDAHAIRMALLDTLKIFIQKEVNIKEVGFFLSFLATVKHEQSLVEVLDLWAQHMEANCKDQMFLLLLEPQTAELIYCLLIDRNFGSELHLAVCRFFSPLIVTRWVSGRHKLSLHLYSSSVSCKSLFPGLISYLEPSHLSNETYLAFFDLLLGINTPSGYTGILYVLNSLEFADLKLKVEVAKHLLTTVFTKPNSPEMIAKQYGWQNMITKMFVKRSIAPSQSHRKVDQANDFISFDMDGDILEDIDVNAEEASESLQETISLNSVVSLPSGNEPGHIPSPVAVSSEENETSSLETTQNENLPSALQQQEAVSAEEQLVYLLTNIIFTILWRGVGFYQPEAWKEGEQIVTAINLLALNNELYCSHLILRMKLLEMTVQALLIDLTEVNNANQMLNHQQSCAQLLRMIYDLVVLDKNDDNMKKCSAKLMDGVIPLLDSLMIFADTPTDDWVEMKRVCLGLLIQCANGTDSDIVAISTAKLHCIFQSNHIKDVQEMGFLVFKLSQSIENAIAGNITEQYSCLIPVMKALLEKSEEELSLAASIPELPPLQNSPVFFQDFQTFCVSKTWKKFISKKIKPLHDAYQKEIEKQLWEPLNTFWAECYEKSKKVFAACLDIEMESRQKFQEKVILAWRHRHQEEMFRQNGLVVMQKSEEGKLDRQHRIYCRARGAWYGRNQARDFWKYVHRENMAKMRLKLEPNLYHNPHTVAANLRDNTTMEERRLSAEFGSSLIPIATETTDEDDFVIAEEDLRFSEEQNTEADREKVVIKEECELIVLMSRIKGRLEVTSNTIAFVDLNNAEESFDFKFPLAHLKDIHLRKYNLRRSAMELFLVDRKSYFINLKTKNRNKIFSKILSLQPPNIQYGSGRAPIELLKSSGLTQKWVNREISNFDYLMHLNTIAGRSYMDLAQYPIFPWILADYTSDTLDLTNPNTFRDLSKPIGVVNPKNEAEVRSKFDNFEDPTGAIPKFHYGTHYSNSAGVLHYLIRIEPFTSLHVELQSGRFDVADRQFQSIGQTWKQLMESPNDVKELIPEFFYSPDFLRNINGLDLGVNTNTKERVDHVILPPWSHSPEDFISIHRRALESEHVSKNLHNWIDLIFGYKQKGPKAAEALNVFYYCTYEGAVDLDKIENNMEREAVEGMINNFGQTPSQLMREPHPKRISQEEQYLKILKTDIKRVDLIHFLDRVNSKMCDMASDRDPVVYLSQPRTIQRGFLQSGPDMMYSISKSGQLMTHNWSVYEKERKGFLFENDPKSTSRPLIGPFHPKIRMNSSLFAINLDGKLLYAGGIWDGSLKVFSVQKGKTVASISFHKDVITCLATDLCGLYLVTGSQDCTSVLWSISNTNLTQNSLGIITQSPDGPNVLPLSANNVYAPQPLRTLYGHDQPVTGVALKTDLDLVVSGSEDGCVNMYCIESGHLVRRLRPVGCTGINIEISFVTINYQGHVAFSALDDTSFSVHVYSINGSHLGSKYVSGRVTHLSTLGDHLVVADDAGDITISRFNGLKPVFDIPLHIPIETVVVTPGNSHILAALRDGSLTVVGVVPHSNTMSPINSFNSRQHSIQTV